MPNSRGAQNVRGDLPRFAFLQALMSQGCITEERALQICSSCEKKQVDAARLRQAYVAKINDKNSQITGLTIKSLRHPIDNTIYFSLVNTKADSASKLGSRYSYPELRFFFAVLEFIATADQSEINENGYIEKSSTDIFNLNILRDTQFTQAISSPQNNNNNNNSQNNNNNNNNNNREEEFRLLNITEKQIVLKKLVGDNWLGSVRQGYFCVGPRSFLELGNLLMEMDLSEEIKNRWKEFL